MADINLHFISRIASLVTSGLIKYWILRLLLIMMINMDENCKFFAAIFLHFSRHFFSFSLLLYIDMIRTSLGSFSFLT